MPAPAATSGAKPPQTRKVKLKTIVIPQEHGGWAFVLNPILLALLVQPSLWGFGLGVAALSAFLVHQPFKLWWKDYRVGRVIARTPIARNFMLIYGGVALVAFGAVLLNNPLDYLLPLVLAFPLAMMQLSYDALGRARELIPELCGAVALAAVGPAMTVLGGWELGEAMLLWLLLVIWATTSIVYVRVRLRLERRRVGDYDLHYVALLHGGGLILVLALANSGALSWLVVLAMVLLAGRAAWGLSPLRRPVKAIRVGIMEVIFGLCYTLLLALADADLL